MREPNFADNTAYDTSGVGVTINYSR